MSITFSLFKNKPNTVAIAPSHHRIEGFLNGFHPHSRGNGGTMFLGDVRGENNTAHVAAVTLWGKDAEFAKAAAEDKAAKRALGETLSLFVSIDAQWQSVETKTGEMNGEHEKTIHRMNFTGRNLILINPFKSGENPRAILQYSSLIENGLPLYNNTPDTIAPSEWFHRIEGFLNGYVPHESGKSGTLFLNDVRNVNNKKTKHVAIVNVWGDDALMIRDLFKEMNETKDSEDRKAVFLSINVRWQAAEIGTGEMNGEYEKKTSRMSFTGKEIIRINPKQSGEYARGILHTSESYADYLRSINLYPVEA